MIILNIILILLFSFNTAYATDIYKKHFDSKYNLIGYSKIEAGKEIHFDPSFKKIGHTVYKNGSAIKFNNSYQKVSTTKKGVIYGKDYRIIGYEREGATYDAGWKIIRRGE